LEAAAEACIQLAALAGSTAVLEACVRDEYELFAERIAHALAPPDGTWKIMDGPGTPIGRKSCPSVLGE
jgi:hypothetical protein